MEPRKPASVKASAGGSALEGRALLGISLSLLMLAGLAGCVPEFFTTDSSNDASIPCQLHTRWEHEVHFPSDTKNAGKQTPTIVGRAYLFPGDLTTPVIADGTILVYLYNDMPDAPDRETPLDIWAIDTKTVKRLERRDAAGWGYTLMLPWGSYRPDLTHVRLQVRFDRIGAKDPLYSDTIPVTFETQANQKVQITHKHTGPVVPKNGETLQFRQADFPAVVSDGPAGPTSGQQVVMPQGAHVDGGEKPETSVTKSAPAAGDNVPFIVPAAGTTFQGNR